MRITQADLEALTERINNMQNESIESYTKLNDGYESNIGTYTLSYAYGGVSLHRYVNESGGINDVFSSGHMPKRELFDRMHSYINGMSDKKGFDVTIPMKGENK